MFRSTDHINFQKELLAADNSSQLQHAPPSPPSPLSLFPDPLLLPGHPLQALLHKPPTLPCLVQTAQQAGHGGSNVNQCPLMGVCSLEFISKIKIKQILVGGKNRSEGRK